MTQRVLGILVALVLGCGSPETPLSTGSEAAALILAGAARALGGSETLGVASIYARAVVSGPTDSFTTTTWSHRDGRTRMRQSTGFDAAIVADSGWTQNHDGTVSPLRAELKPFVRGHELHARVLFPETRLDDATFLGLDRWDGDTVFVVRFTDENGSELIAAYATSDTMPLGFRVMSEEPNVFVRLSDWETRSGIRLFTHAEFRQADEVFVYDYVEVALSDVPDDAFDPPAD